MHNCFPFFGFAPNALKLFSTDAERYTILGENGCGLIFKPPHNMIHVTFLAEKRVT